MIPHPEYASLNVGAHRKPATTISAPGLSRQISFWIPNRPDASDGGLSEQFPLKGADFYQRRKIWKRNIDLFLNNVIQKIHEIDPLSLTAHYQKNTNNYLENEQKLKKGIYLFDHFIDSRGVLRPIFKNENENESCEDPIPNSEGKYAKKVRYEEGRDITEDAIPNRYKIVDLLFFWQGLHVRLKAELHHEYWCLGTFIDLSRAVDKLPDTTLPSDLQHQFRRLRDISFGRLSSLQSKSDADTSDWRNLTANDRSQLAGVHDYLYEKLWEKFDSDIINCSFVIGNEPEFLRRRIGWKYFDSRGVLVHCVSRTSTDDAIDPLFQSGDKGTLREYTSPADTFGGEDEPETAINYIDAFWPFISKSASLGLDNTEYTASKFVNNSVIYVTSLAGEFHGSGGGVPPIKFLILSKSAHRWRLGRLVDSIYLLGNSRVAAIMNIEKLAHAGDVIRGLGTRLNLLSSTSNKDTLKTRVADLLHISNKTADELAKFDGGMEYRIDRSRYYVDQYARTVASLGGREILGFRVFEDFVERRLGSTYRFIDRLGIRLGRHKRDIEALNEEINTAQYKELGSQNLRQQKVIHDLQSVGEKLLLLPLTYYTGHVALEILPWLFPQIEAKHYFVYSASFVIWFVAIVLFHRHHRKQIKALGLME
jgi:hypothetical protein